MTQLLVVIALVIYSATSTHAQSAGSPWPLSLGIKGGYDQPLYLKDYNEVTYQGDLYYGAHLDYQHPKHWGIRLDYANIKNRTINEVPDLINIERIPNGSFSVDKGALNIKREYIGIGPSVYLGDAKFYTILAATFGYGRFRGGDAFATVEPVFKLNHPDALPGEVMENSGFNHKGIAGKLDLDFVFRLSDNWRISAGLSYLHHFNVAPDYVREIGSNPPLMGVLHYEGIIDRNLNTPILRTIADPIVAGGESFNLGSVGLNIGINYRFGPRKKQVNKSEEVCIKCKCPDDQHKVMVTVRDDISKKIIPNVDVALKDMNGSIVATGTTNSYGIVDFGEIDHGNYSISGLVYGIATTTEALVETEFREGIDVIQKEVLYTDLRFILEGNVVNKGTQQPEPNTVVSLTDIATRNVAQDNSDAKGAFAFRLEQNSSYEVIGNKANRLSDIERVSTVGLNRSTTLFVKLNLGMDDFDCGEVALIDIKYAYDKWDLNSSARFELERIIQYLKSQPGSMIEMSSHTDSRGSNDYNYELSQKRAQSAADYIVSRGISRSRLMARGYGENRLKNHCADGVTCSEEEHKINRRTEAKLICN